MAARKTGSKGPAIIVRVSKSEHAQIKKLAKSSGKSVSALIRESVLSGKAEAS